jgi:hypothetical protein
LKSWLMPWQSKTWKRASMWSSKEMLELSCLL